MIHFLRPLTHAFHAHVALGSTWKEEPLRAGPTISHLVQTNPRMHRKSRSSSGSSSRLSLAMRPDAASCSCDCYDHNPHNSEKLKPPHQYNMRCTSCHKNPPPLLRLYPPAIPITSSNKQQQQQAANRSPGVRPDLLPQPAAAAASSSSSLRKTAHTYTHL
jgi:hypothetical protein